MKPFQQWKVLPHGKLVAVDEHILTVSGEIPMPLAELTRRMTVVRLGDGRLVVYSAIALDEAEMMSLEAWGRPTFLIVPSDIHRLDAKIWKDRYPDLRVITPEGARAKVEEVVKVDATTVDFGDPRVEYVVVDGTAQHECALIVRDSSGVTLVVNDLIGNMGDVPGLGGLFLRMAGFAGPEPKVPRVVAMKMVEDRAAVRQQLEAWSGIGSLRRIIMAHGAPIERDAGPTLQRIAASLA